MITKTDVIAKFKQLHKKNYRPYGYMTARVPDKKSDEFFASEYNNKVTWQNTYNRHASDRILIRSCHVTVPLMGHNFSVRFDRPLEKEQRYEFESYFHFGGHCEGYSDTRIVVCYPEKYDNDLNIDTLLLNGAADAEVDADYANQVLMTFIIGGYVKFWSAVTEFEKWFVDEGVLPYVQDRQSEKLIEHIFDTMEPECNPMWV
jgi:hypothetical protein